MKQGLGFREEEEIGIRMRREEKGRAFLSIPMPFC